MFANFTRFFYLFCIFVVSAFPIKLWAPGWPVSPTSLIDPDIPNIFSPEEEAAIGQINLLIEDIIQQNSPTLVTPTDQFQISLIQQISIIIKDVHKSQINMIFDRIKFHSFSFEYFVKNMTYDDHLLNAFQAILVLLLHSHDLCCYENFVQFAHEEMQQNILRDNDQHTILDQLIDFFDHHHPISPSSKRENLKTHKGEYCSYHQQVTPNAPASVEQGDEPRIIAVELFNHSGFLKNLKNCLCCQDTCCCPP